MSAYRSRFGHSPRFAMSGHVSDKDSIHGPFRSVPSSLGGGGSTHDFDTRSIAYSTYTVSSRSTTLPQDEFYQNLVGSFKSSTDADLLNKQISIIKETWGLKLNKWIKLKEGYTSIDPNNPKILKLEENIKKGRKLCQLWSEEIENIIKTLLDKESENEIDFFKNSEDRTRIFEIESETSKQKQTDEWVKSSSQTPSEDSIPILPISAETVETSTPEINFENSSGTITIEDKTESQATIPKTIDSQSSGPITTQSLVDTMKECPHKSTKGSKKNKEWHTKAMDVALKTQSDLDYFRDRDIQNQLRIMDLLGQDK